MQSLFRRPFESCVFSVLVWLFVFCSRYGVMAGMHPLRMEKELSFFYPGITYTLKYLVAFAGGLMSFRNRIHFDDTRTKHSPPRSGI